MDSLEKLYTNTANQSKNKGILNFKGDYDKWKQKKRTIRRADREVLRYAAKSELSHHSD